MATSFKYHSNIAAVGGAVVVALTVAAVSTPEWIVAPLVLGKTDTNMQGNSYQYLTSYRPSVGLWSACSVRQEDATVMPTTTCRTIPDGMVMYMNSLRTTTELIVNGAPGSEVEAARAFAILAVIFAILGSIVALRAAVAGATWVPGASLSSPTVAAWCFGITAFSSFLTIGMFVTSPWPGFFASDIVSTVTSSIGETVVPTLASPGIASMFAAGFFSLAIMVQQWYVATPGPSKLTPVVDTPLVPTAGLPSYGAAAVGGALPGATSASPFLMGEDAGAPQGYHAPSDAGSHVGPT